MIYKRLKGVNPHTFERVQNIFIKIWIEWIHDILEYWSASTIRVQWLGKKIQKLDRKYIYLIKLNIDIGSIKYFFLWLIGLWCFTS